MFDHDNTLDGFLDGLEESFDEPESYSFRDFINRAYPDYQFYRHCEQLIRVLQQVADGELNRLMLFLPPRHGKSLTVTQLFSAYYLYSNARDNVILSSYNKDLATKHSVLAREFYDAAGGQLNPNQQRKDDWQTKRGGSFFAEGVGGSLIGKGFDLGIIDDPIKNAEEAFSAANRQRLKDWYQSTFYTRAQPGASIVLINQRWHRDDLSGFLLTSDEDIEEGWHVVSQEAVKEPSTISVPSTCTLEPDFRKSGEALCADLYDIKALSKIEKTVGQYFWNAQYQQRPVPESGGIWKPAWFSTFETLPESVILEDRGVDYDLAQTKNTRNSASAWIDAAKDGEGNIYVLDAGFGYLEFPELIRKMKTFGGPHYIENKSAGLSAIQTLNREGLAAFPVRVQKDKITRARLATPVAEQGKVYIHTSIYKKLLFDPVQGISEFPDGKKDDVADAFSQALSRLYTPEDKQKKKRTIGAFLQPGGFM